MNIVVLEAFKEGDPVVVTFRGIEYPGTIARAQFDDGNVRVHIPGHGLNKFVASSVRHTEKTD